jgi:hypothetical protein
MQVAARIAGAAGPERVLLIGGLAVAHYTGAQARPARDIELLCLDEAAWQGARRHLEGSGYRVDDRGSWLRAVDPQAGGPLLDLAKHPVRDPRTFETCYLRGAPSPAREPGLAVAAPADLVMLKLIAQRPWDFIDIALLAAAVTVPVEEIRQSAEQDGLEQLVGQGSLRLSDALTSGRLDGAGEQILGRPLSRREQHRLEALIGELWEQGL